MPAYPCGQRWTPTMPRRYGRIVNISSIAAIGTALPGNTFYAATKAEVGILTKRLAMELGSHGITVNAVAPGFIRTAMAQNRRGEQEWQEIARRIAERAMMGRVGEPDDTANAAAFFARPMADGWTTSSLIRRRPRSSLRTSRDIRARSHRDSASPARTGRACPRHSAGLRRHRWRQAPSAPAGRTHAPPRAAPSSP